MALKVYLKKGNQNYKEKRYIRDLTKFVEQKLQEDPLFQFEPAANFKELEDLHGKYCITDVEFTEVKDKGQVRNEGELHDEFRKGAEETVEKEETSNDGGEDSSVNSDTNVDVFNREEPIVRDYVLDEGMKKDGTSDADEHRGQTEFNEPTDFKGSFEMPNNETNPNANKNTQQNGGGNNQSPPKNNRVENPVNPKYNDMSDQKKKRSNKRFAKYIVETICMLTEKGFVWYANKDINEAKLAEYVLTKEINNEDLDLLITLSDGQEATIRQFFQQQCYTAEQLSKIDKEEKEDLIDALAEVLSEKGVAPTPTQELIMISLKVFGQQAVALLTLKSQTGSLITQLKNMKAGVSEEEEEQTQQTTQKRAEPVQHTHVKNEATENKESKDETSSDEKDLNNLNVETPEIGTEIKTIE